LFGSVGRKGLNEELAVLGLAAAADKSGNALYVSLSFGSLDISCVDHLPEELIAVTIQGLSFSMAMGIGPEGTFQRMQLSLQNLQIGDQLLASRYIGCMNVPCAVASIAACASLLTAQESLHSDTLLYHCSLVLCKTA